jgi:hypothetical protein
MCSTHRRVRRRGARDHARVACHALQVGAGLEIAQVREVACHLGRGQHHAHGGHLAADHHVDQAAGQHQVALHRGAEDLGAQRVEEHEAQQVPWPYIGTVKEDW